MNEAAEIVPFGLQSAAGRLAGWECAPPGGDVRGTAVLVPGFTGSRQDFQVLLAQAGCRCVTYDQRGQYQSEGPGDPAGYTIDHFCGDLLDVVAQVADGEPVHLLGHSFGGFVARAAVVARYRAFRSLTMLASGPSSSGAIRLPDAGALLRLIETGGQEGIWQRMGPMLSGAGTVGVHPSAAATVRAAGVPILVAYGTADVCEMRVFERFAVELGARIAVYHGAGCLLGAEYAGQVRDEVVAFWQDVDA
jgi:pimeloyl-ACP methyl ester carboxylesterase